jgi:hypothetical protein
MHERLILKYKLGVKLVYFTISLICALDETE